MDDRDDEGPTAAERAFETLRAEVAGMRQAMQAITEALKKNRPADTTETLGAIAKRLEIVGNFMAAIEQHPAIRMTPTQYNQAIAAAGEGLITKSVRELDSAKAAAAAERRELAAMIGTMRGQWKQWEWLGWTGGATFILGLLISPMFARVLPFGWDGQMAAFIMHGDRWNAGAALMEAGSPQAWRDLESAARLLTPNKVALAACWEAAAKMKKEQRCTVVVPAP
ncbi:MAG TPA: DUF6118 family protein [Steroidobacteraceae bacterium]|nr:DUF6118 family protein [Steroidobacteraceae bacterium]